MKLRLVGLAAVVLAAISGCTGSPNRRVSTPTTPVTSAVATLPRVWTADPPSRWSPRSLSSTAPAFWTTGTAYIVPGAQSLTSYSAATGAQQWSVKLPEPLCTIASGPNAAGIGAVMMGSDGLAGTGGCGRAGAVDIRTGRLLWTTSLKGLSAYGLANVANGPAAVVATSACNTAVTMAIRTGKILVKLPAKSRTDCVSSWASDGTTLVQGQRSDPYAGLIGYDPVSGRQLWTVRAQPDAAHRTAIAVVHRVISSNPLVVEASINQHRFLRVINPKSGTATAFGREGSDSWVSRFLPSTSGRLVVQFGLSKVLFTYDLGTGRQTGRVVLNTNEQFAGLRDGAAITVETGNSMFGAGKLVVRTSDVSTGTQRVLGVVNGNDVTGFFGIGSVSGSTLVVAVNGVLAAYRLPTSGPLASSLPDPTPWRNGDFRPKQAVDLCTGITAATTRAFGFLPPTHAAPGGCGWVENTSLTRIVQLHVESNVSVPTATETAVDVAHRLVVALAKPNAATKQPAMAPLAGLGDEAVMSAKGTFNPSATIIVRRANVVMTVYVTTDGFGRTQTNAIAPLQHALRLAAQDVVAELDRRQ